MTNMQERDSDPKVVILEPGYYSFAYRAWKRTCRSVLRPLWKYRFADFGPRSSVSASSFIVGHRSISIGANVTVWQNVRLEARNARSGTARITLGDEAVLTPGVHVGAVDSIVIGRGVVVGPNVYLSDHDHDFSDRSRWSTEESWPPVAIGDYVARTAGHGAEGRGYRRASVIGAGSIVTRHPRILHRGRGSCSVIRRDNKQRRWVKA